MKWFKKTARLGLTVALIGMLVMALDFYRTWDMPEAPVLPAQLSTVAGDTVSLVTLSQNKPVLIYFWATWCGPCKVTSPTVQWLSERHQVVSIALDSGSNADLAAFLAKAGYEFPVINDPNWDIGGLFDVGVTPTIVILKEGRVSSSTIGISTPFGLWLRLLLA